MSRRAALLVGISLLFGIANVALFLALWWFGAP